MGDGWSTRALGRLLPWAVAALILAYLFASIPTAAVGEALERASWPAVVALALAVVTATLMTDATALWIAIRRSLPATRLDWGDTVALRGASYLLALLSYGAGQGGIVYFLRQRHEVPLAAGAGAVLLATGVQIMVVALAVGLGLALGAVPDRPELRWLAIVVLAGVPIYLLIIRLAPRVLAARRVLAPLFEAGILGTLHVGAARVAHMAVLIIGHWLAMRLFGIEVPAAAAVARLPVLFLVAALPISPSGLGTTQAAAVTLFSEYAEGGAAPEATVLAYSLSFQVIGTAAAAGWGLVCLRRVTTSTPGERS